MHCRALGVGSGVPSAGVNLYIAVVLEWGDSGWKSMEQTCSQGGCGSVHRCEKECCIKFSQQDLLTSLQPGCGLYCRCIWIVQVIFHWLFHILLVNIFTGVKSQISGCAVSHFLTSEGGSFGASSTAQVKSLLSTFAYHSLGVQGWLNSYWKIIYIITCILKQLD